MRGLLSDEEHERILNLFSKAGLSMDHAQFDEDVLERGTQAILKTRDGLLRAAVPSPLGSCVFLNDVSQEELFAALRLHKEIMEKYPRKGAGLEAFVDASDTGYTMNGQKAETTNGDASSLKKLKVLNDDTVETNGTSGATNGANGHTNGVHKSNGPVANGVKASKDHASGPEGVDGMQNGVSNTSVTNGVK